MCIPIVSALIVDVILILYVYKVKISLINNEFERLSILKMMLIIANRFRTGFRHQWSENVIYLSIQQITYNV